MKAHPTIGIPSYFREDDNVEFVLGKGQNLPGDRFFRAIPQDDQWQIANILYKGGGNYIVSDDGGNGPRWTWKMTPVESPERGVILEPLHEGTFFRGSKAYSADPLILAPGMRTVLDHMESQTSFNRVSVPFATGKGWGEVSRLIALFGNYGFITETGSRTWYGPDSEAVLSLKTDKDREHAPGNKMNYAKTDLWPSLRAQFDDMVARKLKNVEVVIGLPLVAPDQEAGLPDDDLVPVDGAAESTDALPVDEGPVSAPEVAD